MFKAVFWKRLILRSLPLPLPIFFLKFASTSVSKIFFKKNLLSLPLTNFFSKIIRFCFRFHFNFFFKKASASASYPLAPLPLPLPLFFLKDFIVSAFAFALLFLLLFPWYQKTKMIACRNQWGWKKVEKEKSEGNEKRIQIVNINKGQTNPKS